LPKIAERDGCAWRVHGSKDHRKINFLLQTPCQGEHPHGIALGGSGTPRVSRRLSYKNRKLRTEEAVAREMSAKGTQDIHRRLGQEKRDEGDVVMTKRSPFSYGWRHSDTCQFSGSKECTGWGKTTLWIARSAAGTKTAVYLSH